MPLPLHWLEGIDRLDVYGLPAVFPVYGAPVRADATSRAVLFNDYGTELVEFYSLFFEGAHVIAGTAQCQLLVPGYTGMFVYDGKAHPGFLLGNRGQGTGRAYLYAFHAKVAGDPDDIYERGTGIDAAPDIRGPDGVIGTDLYAAAATDALCRKDLLGYGAWRPEEVCRHRRCRCGGQGTGGHLPQQGSSPNA